MSQLAFQAVCLQAHSDRCAFKRFECGSVSRLIDQAAILFKKALCSLGQMHLLHLERDNVKKAKRQIGPAKTVCPRDSQHRLRPPGYMSCTLRIPYRI